MKLEFNIHGTFEFDFSEERQKELIQDAKNYDYPGGVASLLLDNLEIARDEASTESTFTLNPYQVAEMLDILMQKEKEENADD